MLPFESPCASVCTTIRSSASTTRLGHPERPERLDAVRRGLRQAGLEERLSLRVPRPRHLGRAAPGPHRGARRRTWPRAAGRTLRFDPDTQAGPRSYEAALLAAGAVVDAVDRVLDGELDRAFCAVRPPGHHAERGPRHGLLPLQQRGGGRRPRPRPRAGTGADRRLRRAPRQRHPGRSSTRTRACSTSPRTRTRSTRGPARWTRWGRARGAGFTVNLPLPAGAGDAEYARVVPRDRDADRPGLRSRSSSSSPAGFDAHGGDPLARRWT